MFYRYRNYPNPRYENRPTSGDGCCNKGCRRYEPSKYPQYSNDDRYCNRNMNKRLFDYGPKPLVIDINNATMENNNFRTALWTGEYLQLTLMSIDEGDCIGWEIHENTDQFLFIVDGQGIVQYGSSKDCPIIEKKVNCGSLIIVPAGNWHNVYNTGCTPLKIYSIYAPPNHPRGTVHATKEIAEEAEKMYHG